MKGAREVASCAHRFVRVTVWRRRRGSGMRGNHVEDAGGRRLGSCCGVVTTTEACWFDETRFILASPPRIAGRPSRATQFPSNVGKQCDSKLRSNVTLTPVPSAHKSPATISSQQPSPARLRIPTAEPTPTRPRAPSSRGVSWSLVGSFSGLLPPPCVPLYTYMGGMYSTCVGLNMYVQTRVLFFIR